MKDLVMCQNKACTVSDQCVRFMMKPTDYQQYEDFAPEENGICDYFIEMPLYPEEN